MRGNLDNSIGYIENLANKIIDVKVVNDLAQLETVIGLMTEQAALASAAKPATSKDEIYFVNSAGDPATLKLIQETLSDGSIVYNVEVS